MSAMVKPRIATYEAAGAISKGKAVKLDSTGKIVTQCSATTDKAVGIAQNAATTAGDLVEVALSGGGGKGLAKATIAAGDILGVNADGSIQKAASANDRMIGIAMESAVAADLFQVDVLCAMATQTQS
jgi:hypothetical protein